MASETPAPTLSANGATIEAFGADVPKDRPGLVEIGFVVAGTLSDPALHAVRGAAHDLCETLSAAFSDFHWRLTVIVRPEPETDGAKQAETSALLRLANRERARAHWDFAFAVTGRDLKTYYRDRAFAAPSRALDCAVLSLARLEPDAADQDNESTLRARIEALVLHLFGHLNTLGHHSDPDNYMCEFEEAPELDRMRRFSDGDRDILHAALVRVADARMEERDGGRVPFFSLRAIWANRHDLAEAVLRAKPWLFPLLFSRLTTAALSTLLVLSVTAEAWELGMTRSPSLVVLLSIVVLVGTSAFILVRQQLLPGKGPRHLSEQRVVVATAAALIMLWGMLTVYVLLFAASFGFGLILISEELARAWAPTLEAAPDLAHYATMAGFTAALGSLIGALGASFEGNSYFRHVVFIDEET